MTIQQTFAIPFLSNSAEDEIYSDFSSDFPTISETPWNEPNIFSTDEDMFSIDAGDTVLLDHPSFDGLASYPLAAEANDNSLCPLGKKRDTGSCAVSPILPLPKLPDLLDNFESVGENDPTTGLFPGLGSAPDANEIPAEAGG